MADLLDEVVLKLISSTIRFFQLVLTLVILGCTAQFIADLSEYDVAIPDGHVAVTAIAGIATIWSLVALLFTFCAGRIMLEIETLFDIVCVALSIAQTVLLREDALSSVTDFAHRYAGAVLAGFVPNRSLVRSSFAVAIVNM
ncbi:hypothetical protein B0H67DRAFT_569571 [Lasiosphaeris hirsuta]|uniref:Uncharacterized protein n=1 Tax=Lasiosphaeris hirsuta TaxID=260670 RepID=A0AA40AZY7_9PEZI|nr:hypothetical protein B0H67DRAFT_569571 [Lasiosphaeris hirsuta]